MTTYADLRYWLEYDLDPARRRIYIGGEIDHCVAERAVKGLIYLDGSADDPIAITINSIGGDWYAGMAVFNAIETCRSFVTITATGQCFSMASVILQAADHRQLTVDVPVLIHDGTEELFGKPQDVAAWAKEMERNRKRMHDIYYQRMRVKNRKLAIATVRELCSRDTIYSASQAVRLGLADELIAA